MIWKCFSCPSCSLDLISFTKPAIILWNILLNWTLRTDWLLWGLGFVLQQFILRQQFRGRVYVWRRDGPTKRGGGGEEKADSDTSEQTLAHEEETQMLEVNRISFYSLFLLWTYWLLCQLQLPHLQSIYLAWVSCLFVCFIKTYKLLCFCFVSSQILLNWSLKHSYWLRLQ